MFHAHFIRFQWMYSTLFFSIFNVPFKACDLKHFQKKWQCASKERFVILFVKSSVLPELDIGPIDLYVKNPLYYYISSQNKLMVQYIVSVFDYRNPNSALGQTINNTKLTCL